MDDSKSTVNLSIPETCSVRDERHAHARFGASTANAVSNISHRCVMATVGAIYNYTRRERKRKNSGNRIWWE